MDLLLYIATLFLGQPAESGPLSVYRPGDGSNSGQLACGGAFTKTQIHIAHRRWKKLGCGRLVVVRSRQTGRVVLAAVRDAGPFGIVDDAGSWRVWTKGRPLPRGWRYRGLTDLSWGLWIRLDRPRFLSRVDLHFLPRGAEAILERLLGDSERSPRFACRDAEGHATGE